MTNRKPIPTQFSGEVASGSEEYEWQDVFRGTSSIYSIESDGHIDRIMGDYLIDTDPETWPEQFRAHRLQLKQSGQPLPKLPKDSLGGKVLIVSGPQVSARRVIAALEQAIADIKEYGLLTGRTSSGELIWERSDGTTKS